MDRKNLARFCGIVGVGSGVLFWLAPIVALKLSFVNTVDVSSQFFWILLMLNLIVIYFGIKGFQTFKGDSRIKNGVRIFYLVAGILIFMPTLQRILPAIPVFQIILGPLLTDKQRMSLQLHHEDDMSLGEIAEELGVSRQAVHDNLQRARHILNDYESKLHLVAQYEQREGLLSQLKATLPKEVLAETKVQQVLAQMEGYYGI